MGAAIRTEIWACLAAGDPDLAAAYAVEDACMDHAGEGIDAAVFLAALEALAFVDNDRDRLLDGALARIPETSELRRAVQETRKLWAEHDDWRTVRERLVGMYRTDNFTDVVLNLCFIVLGMLAGKDFGDAICTAVNCGEDTDCSGATLGAILGIIDPDGIGEQWLAPIGRNLVLSPTVQPIEHPDTLEGFTDLILDLRRRLGGRRPPHSETETNPVSDDLRIAALWSHAEQIESLSDCQRSLKHGWETTFPGNWVCIPAGECKSRYTVVQYPVRLAKDETILLMFATRSPVRVWWDDTKAIVGEGAPFAPSFHRQRGELVVELDGKAGEHTITAAIRNPESNEGLTWCVGLADRAEPKMCSNWLPFAFRRPAQ